MGMRRLIFILGLFIFTNSWAQERVVKDGKSYIVHEVVRGNTIYSLSVLYKVTDSELIALNPILKDGLKIGQQILIPVNNSEDSTNQSKHVVQSKETLFGISRKYGCDVTSLLDLNPWANKGIKPGDEIILPQTTKQEINESNESIDSVNLNNSVNENAEKNHQALIYNDSIVKYTVKKGETLYSISKRFLVSIDTIMKVNRLSNQTISMGDELLIPLKKENDQKIIVRPIKFLSDSSLSFFPLPTKDKYIISVLLPFDLKSYGKIINGTYDNQTKIEVTNEAGLDFFMGFSMALDSLVNLGLNSDIHIFDTEGNSEKLKNILSSPELLQSDLVIGPIVHENIKLVSDWGRENEKITLFPTNTSTANIENNPNAILIVPSELTLIEGMAKFLAKNHWDDQILLIESDLPENKTKIDFFERRFKSELDSLSNSKLIRVKPNSITAGGLSSVIDLDTLNIFLNFSNNVQEIMRFVNVLNTVKNNNSRMKFFVVGNRSWLNTSAFNSYYKNKFNFHFANPTNLCPDKLEFNSFQQNFRNKYNTDASPAAFQGFDVALQMISSMCLGMDIQMGLTNQIDLQRVSAVDGWENKTSFIISQNNFELVLKEVITIH